MITKSTMQNRIGRASFLLRSITVFTLLFGALFVSGQALPSEGCSVRYVYDAAGNRIAREWYCWGEKSANDDLILEGNSLKVFPNPTADIVTIELKEALHNATLELMDTQGRIYKSTNISGSISTLDVSQLSSGTYWIRVGKDGELLISSFTIKK